jgi:hypothetical protein
MADERYFPTMEVPVLMGRSFCPNEKNAVIGARSKALTGVVVSCVFICVTLPEVSARWGIRIAPPGDPANSKGLLTRSRNTHWNITAF